MLEIKNVSKRYGSKQALSDVSLQLPRGQLVGLFGENGAGKTTLMKCILGFISYTGEVTLDGEPITHKNIERIAFATSEHSFFPDLSPAGHAQFYAEHFPGFNRKRFDVDEPFAGNDVFNREDFYKVLLGILNENETVLLSTHLLEEVSGFIGRAVLIHKGGITGDVSMADLDERGESLMDYVKTAWNYRADRISRAITELGEED